MRAAELFMLSNGQSEELANKAGLSLKSNACKHHLNELLIQYDGRYKALCEKAMISERMFQYYRTSIEPTKQTLLSIAIALDLSVSEINALLNKYGYCLSKSLINDAVVHWYLSSDSISDRADLLRKINVVLHKMGLPLLMTRQTGIQLLDN